MVVHVPQNILKLIPFYLSLPHFYLELEVTGKCVNCEGFYGLEIRQGLIFMGLKMPHSGWNKTNKIEEQLKERNKKS